ncbi:hypothetical protein [Fischerella sp. JS2]|nr:hypothetical protein [Fischerella sp. JS2]
MRSRHSWSTLCDRQTLEIEENQQAIAQLLMGLSVIVCHKSH